MATFSHKQRKHVGFAAMPERIYTEFADVRDDIRVFGRQDLLEAIYRTAKQGNVEIFAKFHLDTINQHFGGLSECLAVNVLHMEDGKPDVQSLASVVAGCDTTVSDSYRSALTFDTFTPMTFKHCGSAIFVQAVQAMDAWEETPIFARHCVPCDLHWIVGISYAVPHDKLTFLVFDYMNPKDRPFSDNLYEAEIEYASYPFYLGWLHLRRRICARTLEENLKAYGAVGMTPLRFAVIRAMVGYRQFRTEQLAKVLGTSRKAVQKHLDAAFVGFAKSGIAKVDPTEHLGDDYATGDANLRVHKTNRIATLVDQFSLMRGAPGDLVRKYVA